MTFIEKLRRARELLEQETRLSIRALGRELEADEAELGELVEELVDIQKVAEREGRALVWTNRAQASTPASGPATRPHPDPRAYTPQHLADKILQSKSALEGERKQVTVLFADVKGSMEIAEALDPETWHRVLDRFFRILSDGVHRFEGSINQYTGDGIMALFGAPIAHEDHAQRACYAALELRSELRSYADEVRRTHGVSFSTRMGINSGDVVVGKIGDDLRMDYTAQGHTVGLAQRMEGLAEPGSVLLTRNTAVLVEGFFALRSLGRFDLKGVSQPLEVFELQGIGDLRTRLDRSRARGFSRFVGRSRELETLNGALKRALTGQGQIVGVVAEPGVGKSRLCSEFIEGCRKQGINVHEAHCPAHGKTIHLLPIFELLRDVFGITELDRDQTVREKVTGRLLLLDRELEESLPLVWEFLGAPDPERPAPQTDAQVRQRELHAFARRLVRARSAREPTVFLIDDLHWIDPASDEFLAQTVEVIPSTRTLLLVNFRPEYSAEWMRRSYYQQLPLAALGEEDTRALARDLLGSHPSVADLPRDVAKRTSGNPFYTEEVIQSLADSGQIDGHRGNYRLVTPVESIEVPPTVRSILAARIDRLHEREKRLLQTAAVVGKEFPVSILRSVVDLSEEHLQASLSALQAAEFLYEHVLYPEPEHSFKHPLTHEVAYQSQLEQRRRELHAAVARAIEAKDPERVKASLLAYHWDSAGEIEPAVLWHERAASSIGVLDVREAFRHWERVRDLADQLPPSDAQRAHASEARSRMLWCETRGTSRLDAAALERLYEEACELGARCGDPSVVPRAQILYSNYLLYGGHGSRGLVVSDRAVAEADRLGDVELGVAARYVSGIGRFYLGDLAGAVKVTSEAIELCEPRSTAGTEVIGFTPYYFFRGTRCIANSYLGQRASAEVDATRFRDDDARSDPYGFTLPSCFLVVYHWLTGEFRTGLARARKSVDVAQEFGVPAAQVFSSHMLGMAHTLVEEWSEARAALGRSLEISRTAGVFRQQEAETLTWMGRVLAEMGELPQARAHLEEAERVAERLESRFHQPLIHFARARVHWNEGGADAHDRIESELAASDRCSRELGIRLYEPFTQIERARLCEARGEADPRRAHLEQAHRLFVSLGSERNAERVARELASTT